MKFYDMNVVHISCVASELDKDVTELLETIDNEVTWGDCETVTLIHGRKLDRILGTNLFANNLDAWVEVSE